MLSSALVDKECLKFNILKFFYYVDIWDLFSLSSIDEILVLFPFFFVIIIRTDSNIKNVLMCG